MVVLASGDPLFYGVARYLCDKLGKDRFEVVPHVSSMQLAFARVKESWEEAYLTNLANRPLDQVVEKIRVATKVGLFTSDASPPKAVARALLDRRIDYFSAYVCENLGSPDERVTQGELAEIAAQDFSPLNVMILVRKPNVPDRPSEAIGRRLFGNPDEAFLQSKPKQGLLTPAEVRAMALAEMDLGPTASCGTSAPAADRWRSKRRRLAAGGTAYAIEMDPEDHQLIIANAERFGVANLVAVLGRAPEAWEDLPDPDASSSAAAAARSATSWNWPTSGCGPAAGWWPTSAASKTCRPCTQALAARGQERQSVDDQHRPRHVSTRASALRGLESDVSVGRDQSRRGQEHRRGEETAVSTTEFPQLDVIAVGAHPDDVEIACGGTLGPARAARLPGGHHRPDRRRADAEFARAGSAPGRGQEGRRGAGRAGARAARPAESPACSTRSKPAWCWPRSFASTARGWCWASATRRRWPRPTIGRRCRSPTRRSSTPG